MERLHPSSYNPLFRWEGFITYLQSEQFLKQSFGMGDPLIIARDNIWHSFIDKEKEKECLKKGLALFSSKSDYEAYSKEFRQLIHYVSQTIIPKYSDVPNAVSKKEFKEIVSLLGRSLYLYGLTDFSFHDLAYAEMLKTKSTILRSNLNDLGVLKLLGRKLLNSFAHNKGIVDNVLTCMSQTYFNDNNSAKYLSEAELLNLFQKTYPEKNIIEQRKNIYIIGKKDSQISEINTNTYNIAEEFTKVQQRNTLKGLTAHEGKAMGKVVIAPMLTEKDKIKAVIRKMKQGSILVAHSTTPELMSLINKASAIVTDQGGMLSHAAIVSRERKIPCIVGTLTATKVFNDGDLVEVDADAAIVRKIQPNA